MYQNISDIRQVLIFLVEHLPKKTDFEQTDENKSELIFKQLSFLFFVRRHYSVLSF